jgi:UPF0755 protein
VGWYYEIHAPRRAADAPPQTLTVAPGASGDAVGEQLVELGLLRHPLELRALLLVRGDTARIKTGTYALEGPLSLGQIADKLVQGTVVRHDVTIPEGKSRAEMATIVAARGIEPAEFLKLSADPTLIKDLDPQAPDLEGYLFPDTYDIAQGPNAASDLVKRMVQRFRDVATPLVPRLPASGLTLRQLVTLASIVEMETAQPSERPHVAAVFLNRLKKGIPLQTDPTVIYALRLRGGYDGNIRKADLSFDSPYNTYKYAGLPPGPIASPGRESLLAVLAPAAVKDLYFVSRNDGTHVFSETLAQHERAVDKYQRHRSNR